MSRRSVAVFVLTTSFRKDRCHFFVSERSASCLRQCDTCLEERPSRLVRPQDDKESRSSCLHGALEPLRFAIGSRVALHVGAFFFPLGDGPRHGRVQIPFHGCLSSVFSSEGLLSKPKRCEDVFSKPTLRNADCTGLPKYEARVSVAPCLTEFGKIDGPTAVDKTSRTSRRPMPALL